jgi:hypothetical protein
MTIANMPFLAPNNEPLSENDKKLHYISTENVIFLINEFGLIAPEELSYRIDVALEIINKGHSIVNFDINNDDGLFRYDGTKKEENLIGLIDRMAKFVKSKKMTAFESYDEVDFRLAFYKEDNGSYTFIADTNQKKELPVRPKGERPAILNIGENPGFEDTEWNIHVPLLALFKNAKIKKNAHMGYSHHIHFFDNNEIYSEKYYVYDGITKRNWLTRMKEHFREMGQGSNKLFHRTWRAHVGNKKVVLTSVLSTLNKSYNAIMEWEEKEVKGNMKEERSLNMIPGGFEGIKFLHTLRLLNGNSQTVDERNAALSEYERTVRTGPNPVIRALWLNDSYAINIICGAEGRLSPEQVFTIREMGMQNIPASEIVERVSALNILQVQRVLENKTYTRVK